MCEAAYLLEGPQDCWPLPLDEWEWPNCNNQRRGTAWGEKEGEREEHLGTSRSCFHSPPLPNHWSYGLDYIRYTSTYRQICSNRHPAEQRLLAKPLHSIRAATAVTMHKHTNAKRLASCWTAFHIPPTETLSRNAAGGFPEIFLNTYNVLVISKVMF